MTEKQKILVVDDEQRNLRIVQLSLPDTWDLQLAENGEKAMSIIENEAPDLVLLDIMMPGIDGYEVCRRIRAMPSAVFTKVILVSGKAMLEERLKGYEVGADDYITKPFVPEELAAKATVFLRLTQVEKQLKTLNSSLEQQVQKRTEQLLATEAKLINSAKMSALGEMAGGIAHEINTPLSAIGMRAEQIAELLDDNPLDKETIKEMSNQIAITVQRIGKIIFGLLSFARSGEKESNSLQPVQRIIDDTLSLCAEKFKNTDIKLSVEMKSPDIAVDCHVVQASQVLLNLLNNAHDAVLAQDRDKRWIRIEVSNTEEGAQLSVTDSGEKISPSVREKMFQPFFTTKDIGKGTGIGLSLSKGLMESQGGSLLFNDQSEQTCFVMQFPKRKAS